MKKKLAIKNPVTIDVSKITRITIVGSKSGRLIEKWNTKVEISVQDEGRTLKIFYI